MGDKRYRVGGTRGGQDQFKWEDVKGDVHRENYLGHSLLAPVGRWQRGKDLKWWNKKGDGGADAARAQAEMEKARVKQLDEDLLNEALGFAPRKVRTQQLELSKADKKQLLEKGTTVDGDGMDTERVSGLGAGPAKLHEHIPSLTLKERELERLKRERERKEGGLTEESLVEIVDYEKEQRDLAAAKAAANPGVAVSGGSSRKSLKEEKRAKKREKKEKKKAKKETKKEKKKAKKAKEEAENGERQNAKNGVHQRRQPDSSDQARGRDAHKHETSDADVVRENGRERRNGQQRRGAAASGERQGRTNAESARRRTTDSRERENHHERERARRNTDDGRHRRVDSRDRNYRSRGTQGKTSKREVTRDREKTQPASRGREKLEQRGRLRTSRPGSRSPGARREQSQGRQENREPSQSRDRYRRQEGHPGEAGGGRDKERLGRGVRERNGASRSSSRSSSNSSSSGSTSSSGSSNISEERQPVAGDKRRRSHSHDNRNAGRVSDARSSQPGANTRKRSRERSGRQGASRSTRHTNRSRSRSR
ncbi:unnamed protein product [Ectocarpus sp. 12 AP-2014]